MATKATAEIFLQFQSDLRGIREAVTGVSQLKTGFGGLVKAGGALGLGFLSVQGAVAGLANAFRTTILAGVQFNKTLEQAELSVAAVLKQFNPGKYQTFTDAIKESREVIDELKVAAKQTNASFEEMLDGYSSTAGVMTAAGIPLSKQVELLVTTSQAMSALGVNARELRQELTALLMGTIDRNAKLATMLQQSGLTKEGVLQARQQGRLFEYVSEKMVEFANAGRLAGNTVAVLESNLGDAKTQVAADATKELSEAYRELLVAMTEMVQSDSFRIVLKMLADVATVAVKASTFAAEATAQAEKMSTPGMAYGPNFTNPVAQAQIQTDAARARRVQAINSYSGRAMTPDDVAAIQRAETQKVEAAENAKRLARKSAVEWLEKEGEKLRENLEEYRRSLQPQEEQLRIVRDLIAARERETAEAKAKVGSVEEAERIELEASPKLIELKREQAKLERDIAQAKREQVEWEEKVVRAFEEQSLADQESGLRESLTKLEMQRAALDFDFTRTSAEKRAEGISLLRQERAELEEFIRLLERQLEIAQSPETRELIRSRIDGYTDRLNASKVQSAGLEGEPDPNSFGDQVRAEFTSLSEQWGTLQQQMARGLGDVASTLSGSVSGALQGLITRTMTWGQALGNIGVAFGQSMLRAFTDMIAQYAVSRAAMFVINKLFGAQEAGAVAIQAGTALAAWTPAAIAASIATFGAASAAGTAAFAAALAGGTAMGVAAGVGVGAAGLAGAGFYGGGYTGDGNPRAVAGPVHKKEFVFDHVSTARIGRQNLEALRIGKPIIGGGEALYPVENDNARQMQVVLTTSELEATRLKKNSEIETQIIRVLNNRRHEVRF